MNRISLFSSPFRGWSSNILARLLLAPNPSSDELRQCLAMLTTRLALGSGDGHTSIEASLDTPHDIWLIAESRVLAKVKIIARLALRRRAASWQKAVKALSVEEVGLCSAMCSGELGSVHLISGPASIRSGS
ncbi:hypothetical protein KCU93_g329, partial [Aureobasidium melanogenum]